MLWSRTRGSTVSSQVRPRTPSIFNGRVSRKPSVSSLASSVAALSSQPVYAASTEPRQESASMVPASSQCVHYGAKIIITVISFIILWTICMVLLAVFVPPVIFAGSRLPTTFTLTWGQYDIEVYVTGPSSFFDLRMTTINSSRNCAATVRSYSVGHSFLCTNSFPIRPAQRRHASAHLISDTFAATSLTWIGVVGPTCCILCRTPLVESIASNIRVFPSYFLSVRSHCLRVPSTPRNRWSDIFDHVLKWMAYRYRPTIEE